MANSLKITGYFKANDITFNDVEIQDKNNSYSIVATRDLPTDHTICKIPKSAILSIRNTAIADIIEQEEFSGLLGISLALMYEKSLLDSPFKNYLESIPAFEYIPLFWSDQEAKMLINTDVGRSLEQDKQFLVDDYNTFIQPLFAKYPQLNELGMTLDDWLKSSSLISSRAFEVDEFHGESLVPFADLFNHKTDGEHVHIVGDEVDWEDSDADHSSIPELDDDQEIESSSDCLEMVTIKSVVKGEEVFNTYGDHPNSSLLRLYGFCELDNQYSTVFVDRLEVVSELGQIEQVVDRVEYWDQVGKEIIEELSMMEEEVANGGDQEELDANGEKILKGTCCEGNTCGEGCGNEGEAGDDDDGEYSEGDEDMNLEGDEETPLDDDFYFGSDGNASFALIAFAHLLLMTPELFEKITSDLGATIDMFVAMRQSAEKNIGQGERSELQSFVDALLARVAKNRLDLYPKLPCIEGLEGPSKWACMLQAEEKEILNKFCNQNK